MALVLPGLVYLLCFLSSGLCAGLLIRRYMQARTAILLWSGACFFMLAINNLLVVLDLVVLVDLDLRSARLWMSFIAVSLLLFGFIWEVEK